jgi:hypothetical protein
MTVGESDEKCELRDHTAKRDHVTYLQPARNRGKHVWSLCADVRKIQAAALAAHLRPPKGEPLRPDRPSQVGKPAKGKVPRFTVRPRDASRWQDFGQRYGRCPLLKGYLPIFQERH